MLITGASSGIGNCCVRHLSGLGYRVYGVSRSAGDPRMDVTDDLSVSSAINAILEREGRLDVVVNNAGFGIAGAIEDTAVEEAWQQFDVNVLGVLRVCRAVLPCMRRQGGGYIVNIGSIGGLIAIPYQGLYSASKFALEGLTEALRMEVSSFGIKVVLIEPGDHRTSFTENRRLAAASGSSVYREPFLRATARMASDEQSGPAPEGVARVLRHAIEARSPRLRYTVGPGPQRAAIWLKRLMPYAVVEAVISRYYGV